MTLANDECKKFLRKIKTKFPLHWGKMLQNACVSPLENDFNLITCTLVKIDTNICDSHYPGNLYVQFGTTYLFGCIIFENLENLTIEEFYRKIMS